MYKEASNTLWDKNIFHKIGMLYCSLTTSVNRNSDDGSGGGSLSHYIITSALTLVFAGLKCKAVISLWDCLCSELRNQH